jgi:lambda family phage portal protein
MADETALVVPTGAPSFGAAFYRNLETFPGQVWSTPPITSSRQEVRKSRKDVVRAARHVERYSEHIRGGIERKADMVVGWRLRVHARPDWDTLGIDDWKTKKPFAQALERVFNNWGNDVRLLQDGEGHYDFGGMMWLAMRNLTGPDGECAGVIHYDEDRAALYRTKWATYLTVVDPDRIETPPEYATNPNVQDGKLLDPDGRMLGFFCRKAHPTEYVDAAQAFVFVPRESPTGRPIGFHWFVKTRGAQLRGVSSLVTILKQSGMLDKFDDAYLAAAVINQVLATWIQSPASTVAVAEAVAPPPTTLGEWNLFESKISYYDKVKMRIGGARIPVMPPGDEIKMSAVNRAIDDPSAFRNGFLREFASALNISFEQLSLNFSDANYSAARAAILEIWRGIQKMRGMFGQHVAALVYAAVIEEAIVKGYVELPAGAPPFNEETRAAYTACMWTGPGMPAIDPQKEANAIKTHLELKTKSRQQVVAEDGGDYLETFDQIEQERIEAEERGFSLDPLPPGSPASEEAAEAEEGSAAAAKPKKKGGSVKDGDGDGTVQEKES